jgi:hypothetical protein
MLAAFITLLRLRWGIEELSKKGSRQEVAERSAESPANGRIS